MKQRIVSLAGILLLAGCSGDGPLTRSELLGCELPPSPFAAAAMAGLSADELAEASRDAVERLIPALMPGEDRNRLNAALEHFATSLTIPSTSIQLHCLAAVTADRALRPGSSGEDAADRAAIRLVVDVLIGHLAYGTTSLADHDQFLW